MADITTSVQQIDQDGLTPAYNAALNIANTYKVRNDGHVFLHAKNADVSDHSVTIAAQMAVTGLSVPDRTVSVTAGEERMIGPFPPRVFNDANDDINVTVDDATSMSLAAFRL